MAAELMALVGDKLVLILAPKALVWQWQGELMELLDTQPDIATPAAPARTQAMEPASPAI